MNLIRFEGLGEGELLNKWFENRLIRSNKNIIGLVVGSTGTGKSFVCVRIAELWYKHHFKKEFPIHHVQFSVEGVIDLLNSGKLKRGDVIILEEAGTSMGALDFQAKISKIFTYVLQSFRNLNLCLMLNLPSPSMLNKNVRLLSHFQFETAGIDKQKKTSEIKPFFVQTNTRSGKRYLKYMNVKKGNRALKIQRFVYSIPSKDLVEAYEKKKRKFVLNLISDFHERANIKGSKPDKPSDRAFSCHYKYTKLGEKQEEIAEEEEISQQSVSKDVKQVEKWLRKSKKAGK